MSPRSLQSFFGPDVDAITLIIPAGSLIDGLKPLNGTAKGRPDRLLGIYIVCGDNFETICLLLNSTQCPVQRFVQQQR